MDKNRYGLDCRYFRENFEVLLRDMENYTPEEMERALTRLAVVARPEPVEQQAGEQED